jgi:hypothetical protein
VLGVLSIRFEIRRPNLFEEDAWPNKGGGRGPRVAGGVAPGVAQEALRGSNRTPPRDTMFLKPHVK